MKEEGSAAECQDSAMMRPTQAEELHISEDFAEMPIIDLQTFLNASAEDNISSDALIECKRVAECFHRFGIILIKDPRVDMQDNEEYIDLMEGYFADVGQRFYDNEVISDIKAEHHYQVGATPEFIEKARDHQEKRQELNLAPEDTPLSPLVPVFDAKWRFFWKVGERPEGASDDFPQVIPDGYPTWERKMDNWGSKLHTAIHTVAEMAALGMDVEKDAFTRHMNGGAHLLAPTGSDL